MSTATGMPFDLGTWSDGDADVDFKPEAPSPKPQASSAPFEDQVTESSPLDRLQADVAKIGGDRCTASLKTQLAMQISRSQEPGFDALVNHCIWRASQDKIQDGAEVLSQTGDRFVQYLDDSMPEAGPDRDSRIWLFAEAAARMRPPSPSLFAKLLTWLMIDDSSIRETAANALARIGDPAAVAPLRRILPREQNPAAKEAIEDAIDALGG